MWDLSPPSKKPGKERALESSGEKTFKKLCIGQHPPAQERTKHLGLHFVCVCSLTHLVRVNFTHDVIQHFGVGSNGTSAMNEQVKEGDVFWVPRYFPFCQTASRGGPMEFFGFTTSARKNRPQFLAGSSSVLQAMRGPELAAAFDVSMERLDRMVKSQQESIILPAPPLLPQQEEEAGSSLLEKW